MALASESLRFLPLLSDRLDASPADVLLVAVMMFDVVGGMAVFQKKLSRNFCSKLIPANRQG